jgi:hypothetical protein
MNRQYYSYHLNEFFAPQPLRRGIRFVVFCVITLAGSASAQECPDTLWTRVHTRPGANWIGQSTVRCRDHGYLIAGSSGGWPEYQMLVLRMDSLGDTLWSRRYGEPELNEGCLSAIEGTDGSFALAGWRAWGDNNDPEDSAVVYVLKIDSIGDTLWTRTYSCAPLSVGWQIIEVSTGGYAIVGCTNYFEDFIFAPGGDADSSDALLLRITENGDSMWCHRYGGNLGDEGFAVMETGDGGFVVAGTTASYGDIQGDAYMARTDAQGTLLWSHTYGHAGLADYVMGLDATSDGYIMGGETIISGSAAYVARVDNFGVLMWDTTYRHNFSTGIRPLVVMENDAFVAAAASLYAPGGIDLYVIWGDGSGRLIRDCVIPFPYPTEEAYASTIFLFPDNSYAFSGSTGHMTDGVFLLRTEIDPDDACEPPSVSSGFDVAIYPNPFNSSTTLSLDLPATLRVQISIYNLLGERVLTVADELVSAGHHAFAINGADLPTGLYFAQVRVGGITQTQKVMLLR